MAIATGGSLTVAAGTDISVGTVPTASGIYDLIAGDPGMLSGVNLTNFTLPAAVTSQGFKLGFDPANGAIARFQCLNQGPWSC